MKVLYTFDDQSKVNCLARWPHVLHIRTAHLDEATQIGVVELKTCVQAIVTASPEIVAKLGQDYTVYAFDYSEYDTPLVGQGMLSWVLGSASASQSGAAAAQPSRAIVTGRVSRNVMGLFGNGVAETLEVKLRLVPMPTVTQNDYIESMKKYREMSRAMPENFDPQGWSEFLKMNPGVLGQASSRPQSPTVGSGTPNMGIEHVQRLFDDQYAQQGANTSRPHSRRYSQASSTVDPEELRRPSPAPSMQSMASRQSRRPLSRSASGQSYHDAPFSTAQSIPTGFEDGCASFDDQGSEGPARKRAKVVPASHPSRKSLGNAPESLRVAASTAASVRGVFQPTAMRPGQNPAHSLEGPPRAPTPVPQGPVPPRRPQLQHTRSHLSYQASYTSDREEIARPTSQGGSPGMVGSAVTSPEASHGGSAGSTPADLTSSPPIGHSANKLPPSSPILPAMRRSPPPALTHADSGFVSGALESLFVDGDDGGEDRSPDAHDLEVAQQYSALSAPGPAAPEPQLASTASLKPTSPTAEPEDPAAMALKLSRLNARRATKRLTRVGSDTTIPPSSEMLRSEANPLPRLDSEASTGAGTGNNGNGRGPVQGNREKRRAAVQNKLYRSIENGEVPSFCENCGAIETPVWRKAHWKLHSGSMDRVKCSNVEGGVIGIQIVECNEDGSTKLFKIFKKSLLADDQDFHEALMCNRKLPANACLCPR